MKLRNKKTGEIFDLDKMPTWLKETIQICANFYWRECELYEPAEPLIKDEKIRRAVRAWAEANDIGVVKFRAEEHRLFDKNVAIEFDEYIFEELQDGWNYSIAELCGDEEE